MVDEKEIRKNVKEIIHNVTNIPIEDIGDKALFLEDLDLDSLSLLEIGVDVDYKFKLGLPEEDLQGLTNVQEVVDLVLTTLRESTSKVPA